MVAIGRSAKVRLLIKHGRKFCSFKSVCVQHELVVFRHGVISKNKKTLDQIVVPR